MSKATPGPWVARLDNPASPYMKRIVETADHRIVAGDIGGHDAATTGANARLIAAAPDLLEALEECAEYGALTWGHDPENEPNCYRAARAAIAKARVAL